MALIFSLHTDDPGDVGCRPRNEIAYADYKRRPAIERRPGLLVSFPQCSKGPATTATHWAVTTDGELRCAGALHPPITVSPGVTPQVTFSGEMADMEAAIRQARELRGWR